MYRPRHRARRDRRWHQFVVSPVFDPEIVATTIRYGKISVPGAYTPTEILPHLVLGRGCRQSLPRNDTWPRVFQRHPRPLPQLRLTPTGGVDTKTTPQWIKAGAVFVGAGSALVSKDAMDKGDWSAITANAKAFVEAVKQGRELTHNVTIHNSQ